MTISPDTSNYTEPCPAAEPSLELARTQTLSIHARLLKGAVHGDSSSQRQAIDHDQVRCRERVMAELLVAARMTRRRRLSRLAEVALSGAGQDFSTTGLVATAHVLRRQCIELGMPECRYRDLDWRLRGLE